MAVTEVPSPQPKACRQRSELTQATQASARLRSEPEEKCRERASTRGCYELTFPPWIRTSPVTRLPTPLTNLHFTLSPFPSFASRLDRLCGAPLPGILESMRR